jgi:hypothetical protein
MKFKEKSNLDEFAYQFWRRQRLKGDKADTDALASIHRNGDQLRWLVNLYPYKLPHPYNDSVEVQEIETKDEVNNFLIHYDLPRDQWMVKRGVAPCPYTRRLGELAKTFRKRRYFDTDWPDTQRKCYGKWKDRASLKGVIGSTERPLIEMTWTEEYEIVDGWGRLLPFAALLEEGFEFHPFECFVATRRKSV